MSYSQYLLIKLDDFSIRFFQSAPFVFCILLGLRNIEMSFFVFYPSERGYSICVNGPQYKMFIKSWHLPVAILDHGGCFNNPQQSVELSHEIHLAIHLITEDKES